MKKFGIILILLAGIVLASCQDEEEPANKENAIYTYVEKNFSAGEKNYTLLLNGVDTENSEEVTRQIIENFEKDKFYQIQNGRLVDAEKASLDPEQNVDNSLCWGATASNLLWLTGWAREVKNPLTGGLFKNEDEVFSYFIDSAKNSASEAKSGIMAFLNGKYAYDGAIYNDNGEVEDPNEWKGGSFYPEICAEKVLAAYDGAKDWSVLKELFKEGAIGGELSFTPHAITVNGLIFEEESGKIRSMIITDSDDHVKYVEGMEKKTKEEQDLARRKRPNTLTVSPCQTVSINGHNRMLLQVKSNENGGDLDTIGTFYFLKNKKDVNMAEITEKEGSKDPEKTIDIALDASVHSADTDATNDFFAHENVLVTCSVKNTTDIDLPDAKVKIRMNVQKDREILKKTETCRTCSEWSLYPHFPTFGELPLNQMVDLTGGDYEIHLEVYLLDENDQPIPESYYLNNEEIVIPIHVKDEEYKAQ